MSLRTDSAHEWEHRVDRGELRVAHRESNGTIHAEGFAAKAGVLTYNFGGRVVRELVREDTLRQAAAGLGRAPVTLGHPDPQRYPKGVDPDNVERLQVGDTDGEVEYGKGGYVKVRLSVRRRDAINAVNSGTHELSPGYDVRIDRRGGVDPVHGAYDQEQVERQYNHLAIVDRARGGVDIGMRADAGVATTVISGAAAPANPSGASRSQGAQVNSKFIPLLTLLGITSRVDSDDDAIRAIGDALEKQRADSAGEATKLATEKARADTEKARADTAEVQVKTLEDAEKVRADKADRSDLELTAKALNVDPAKHADVPALRKAIAQASLGASYRADGGAEYDRVACDLAKKSTGDGGQRGDGREAGRTALAQAGGAGGAGGTTGARADAAPTGRPSLYQLALQRGDAMRKGAKSAGGES